MVFYNTTGIANSENFADFFIQASLLSGGWLGLAFLVTLSFVTFISLKNFPTKEAFAANMFLSTITAFMFYSLGVIGFNVVSIYLILLAVAIIALFKRD